MPLVLAPVELILLLVRVLNELEERRTPLVKPITIQFLTVTPVLPDKNIPLPEPFPVMLWPLQSSVTLSAPMYRAVPSHDKSSVRIVSDVNVSPHKEVKISAYMLK